MNLEHRFKKVLQLLRKIIFLYGEVIGVNAAIATESGGLEGIGFTIPSNMAVYVAKALIARGKVERGWLGVTIRSLTPELAQSLHLESLKGALVVALPFKPLKVNGAGIVYNVTQQQIKELPGFHYEKR